MKKLFFCILMISGIVFILIINGPKIKEEEKDIKENRGIFISYIELSKYFNCKSKSDAEIIVDEMINNVESLGFNEIILQVRSFSDAIYKSDIYPWSMVISSSEGIDPGYDLLEIFIDKCHEKDILLTAWINPFRIRNNEDISSISKDNFAFKYLNTEVVYINNGIYFNPSSDKVLDLIVDGVEEIVRKYDVDGILFDDYFYPDNEIDRQEYDEYLKNNEYISKEEYNLNVINNMVKKVYEVCKKYNVLFGISPDGNIDNNYNKVFADVKKWCSSNEYIDFIMPQIYYGFYNEARGFKKAVDEWENFVKDSDVKLKVALAFYKNGTYDKWAMSGSNEWIENDDIIMREIVLSRNLNKYNGFSLFRYDYIFSKDKYTEVTLKEIENIKIHLTSDLVAFVKEQNGGTLSTGVPLLFNDDYLGMDSIELEFVI